MARRTSKAGASTGKASRKGGATAEVRPTSAGPADDEDTTSHEEPVVDLLPPGALAPAGDRDDDDEAALVEPAAPVDEAEEPSDDWSEGSLEPVPRPAPLAPARDPVRRFVEEARRHPRLSDEEERALVAAARGQGDLGAARKLVVHNLRLVISIAYQYRRTWTNLLDLFQEGSVGLMEAVKRWDPAFGTRFGTYAAYWIRAYILRFLMTNARLIHVGNTRAGRKLFFRLEKERQKLLAAGFDVTPKLLAAKLDVDEKDLEEVQRHLDSREVSFEPRPDVEGLSLEERVTRPNQATPEDQTARAQLADAVRSLSDQFGASLTDPREQVIWREHLAATDEPRALGELGERFGVSKQRMGQIADRLKKRFREQLEASLGHDIKMSWQSEAEE